MSPIEKIRLGILSGDIQVVHEGYVALTGETLLIVSDDSIELATEASANVAEKRVAKKTTRKKAVKKKAVKKKAYKKKATKSRRKKSVAEKNTARKQVSNNDKGFIVLEPEEDNNSGPVSFKKNLFESMMGYEEELTDAEKKDMEKLTIAKKDKYVGTSKTCVKCNATVEVHPSRIIPGTRFWCDKCLTAR